MPAQGQSPQDVINVRFHTGFSKCNFSCSYCIAGHGDMSMDDDGDLVVEDDAWDGPRFERIVENIKKLPLRMNIRLRVPGEIFLNKRLLAGAKSLARSPNVRSLNILTNLSLSLDYYQRVLADVDPSRWAFVASFHATEIKDSERWIQTAVYMHRTFDFCVALVAHPPLLNQIAARKKRLEAEGLEVFVQAYIGLHNGKQYPQAYTEEERRLLRTVMYSRHDYEFLVELRKPQLCNAGHRSFYVHETGKVTPCGMGYYPGFLGDLSVSPEVALNPKPQMCPFQACQCDTENMNTLVFQELYAMKGINQHKYRYRFAQATADNPAFDQRGPPS
jgi:hypothetical protein